jgi:serine/threonine-protein kinase
MSVEGKKEIQLEIAHVLFIDIVGYSRLLIDEQRDYLHTLNDIVRETEAFHAADAAGKLTRLPTGDGMALVFATSPDAPVSCALQVSKALQSHPELRVRMGIHSGPVSGITDVNDRSNVAGAGINLAQRVMDCGDAGHVLLSKHVADDLEQYRQWRPHLHDLGECEVKHDVRIHVVNLHTDELGNPEIPEKFKVVGAAVPAAKANTSPKYSLITAAVIVVVVATALVFFRQVGTPLRGVRQIEAGGGSAASLPIAEKSIAVLPFENLSENKENAFFADGVQDEILTNLAKVADLKVISRTSVISYRNTAGRNLRKIGEELGVAHLLEGSVQRAGNRVRVNAQLIDARTDAHLWAQTYDRDLADVFAIQSEIAKTIADQLRAKLSPSEKAAIEEQPTKDITANDLFVRAKLLNEASSFNARRLEQLVEAAGLLDQAVSRDPAFLLAHCLLSNTHALIYFYGLDHTPSRRTLAEAAVNAASRLRPDAGETHLARADLFYRCYLDYDRARSELALAQRSLPNNAQVLMLMGYIDRRQSRWKESVQNTERALELDPRNWFYLQQLSLSYQFLRRYADMAAALDRVIVILPDDVVTRVTRAVVDLDWRADLRPLHDTVEAVMKENPSAAGSVVQNLMPLALCERDPKAAERAIAVMPPQGIGPDQLQFPIAFWKGLVARMQGNSAAARDAFIAARDQVERMVHEQPDYGPALCMLGIIDVGLGRKEEGIAEGRKAVDLLPRAKDAVNGGHMIEFLAVIYAWAGEKDLAIEQLTKALQSPSTVSYGQLKLHPFWDPLRGDPRFEKIVASVAPK